MSLEKTVTGETAVKESHERGSLTIDKKSYERGSLQRELRARQFAKREYRAKR